MIIAIDGPAGSGKSTTARAVSSELGFLYVDTGAMYRAFGLAFRRSGADARESSIRRLIESTSIDLEMSVDSVVVFLNGEDVTEEIRTQEAARLASQVAALPSVRASMVDRQREIAREAVATVGGAVLEGRDIGTVVFPNAELKVFLEADLEERARRRQQDLGRNGIDPAELKRQMKSRDEADSNRAIAPLKPAEDAIHIDTTHLTFEQQVGQIVGFARELTH